MIGPDRETSTEHRAAAGQEKAFGEQLANHPRASCSQREPDCNFAGTPGSARHQQIRHIRAGDQKNEPYGGHEHEQGVLILPSKDEDAAASRLKVHFDVGESRVIAVTVVPGLNLVIQNVE